MRLFLPEDIWKNKRGIPFREPVFYLVVGYHTGQDFLTNSVNEVPVKAPCSGILTAIPNFSKDAGWWGYFTFYYKGETYSLKILHMYEKMRSGEYGEGDTLGYCGATGLSVKNNKSYNIGPSHTEQTSENAVPHLHVELHKGEYQNDTNKKRNLADKHIIDPVSTFEQWINEVTNNTSNNMVFYKEFGKSSVYMKGTDNVYYPIIIDRHFKILFGEWKDNIIKELDNISPKSDSYFGLFKSDEEGKYDTA